MYPQTGSYNPRIGYRITWRFSQPLSECECGKKKKGMGDGTESMSGSDQEQEEGKLGDPPRSARGKNEDRSLRSLRDPSPLTSFAKR